MSKFHAKQRLNYIVEFYLKKCRHRLNETIGKAEVFDFNLIQNVIKVIERKTKTEIFADIYRCNTFSADTKILHNDDCTLIGVVHDAALTDIFSSLSYLYLNEAQLNDYKKYTCKLLAERLFNLDKASGVLNVLKQYFVQPYQIDKMCPSS